jgi:hypothetical protein
MNRNAVFLNAEQDYNDNPLFLARCAVAVSTGRKTSVLITDYINDECANKGV